jgi:hypothetical protein
MPDSVAELQSAGAWQFFQDMLRDMTTVVTEDAESESEFVEGLRVIARISSLCAQLSVEADPDQPSFFDMCTPTRMVGGPNPDGNYYLAMIRGDRSYRITGHRGTSAYLGLHPRRHRTHSATDGRLSERCRLGLDRRTIRAGAV